MPEENKNLEIEKSSKIRRVEEIWLGLILFYLLGLEITRFIFIPYINLTRGIVGFLIVILTLILIIKRNDKISLAEKILLILFVILFVISVGVINESIKIMKYPGPEFGATFVFGAIGIIAFLIGWLLMIISLILFSIGIRKKGRKFIVISSICLILFLVLFFLRIGITFGRPKEVEKWVTEPFKKNAEEITQKAIETRDIRRCLQIHPLPFLPQIISRFLFWEMYSDVAFGRDIPLVSLYQGDCIIKTAIFHKEESWCNKIKILSTSFDTLRATSYFDKCVGEVGVAKALAKRDTSLCERLEGGFKAKCYQEVFFVSEKYRDILTECRKLPEYDDFGISKCIKDMAVKIRDIELCKGTLPNEDIECRKGILIATSDILASCKDLLTIKGKNECVKNIAIERDDINLCRLLPLPTSDECYREIIFSGRRGNFELCKEEFSDELSQGICSCEVTVNKNDLTQCDKGFMGCWWWCYTGIAIKKNDLEICKKFSRSEFDEEDCLTELAVKTDNLEICKKIKDQYDQEECVAKIAIKRGDVNLCKTITHFRIKWTCPIGISVDRDDLEMCQEISKEIPSDEVLIKYECFEQIAIKRNNPEICGYIERDISRRLCYEEFEK
jgi:hypothetical protein